MRLLLLIIGVIAWHATLISTKDDTIPISPETEDNYDLEAQYRPFRRLVRSRNSDVSEGNNNQSVEAIIKSINTFAAKFFKVFLETERNKISTKSIVCSPIGTAFMLSMAAFGARGETAKQFRKVLAHPAYDDRAKIGFQTLTKMLKDYGNVNVVLLIRIFPDKRTVFQRKFHDTALEAFDSTTHTIDFRQPEKAANIINKWYSVLIGDEGYQIFRKADFNKKTSFVLANFLYIDSQWSTPFNSANTKNRTFHINDEWKINIPTMYGKQRLQYGVLPALCAKFVGIPLKIPNSERGIMMYIIRPVEINGLAYVEKSINPSFVNTLMTQSKPSTIELYLPKFEIVTNGKIDGLLKTMGLKNMFTKFANFSGIVEKSSGWNGKAFNKVVQSAAIGVSEVGVGYPTVGDDSEVPHTNNSVDSLKAIVFKADRPFLWTIASNDLRVPLFIGRYTGRSN